SGGGRRRLLTAVASRIRSPAFRDHAVEKCSMTINCHSCRPSRRAFLADLGLGFTGLALGAMLQRDGFANPAAAWAPPDGKPHARPKAKSVIWLFMNGGMSHLETFDPKPALNDYAGKSINETPFKDTHNPEKLKLAQVVENKDQTGHQP